MVGLLLRQNVDYLMDALSHRLKYLREVISECADSMFHFKTGVAMPFLLLPKYSVFLSGMTNRKPGCEPNLFRAIAVSRNGQHSGSTMDPHRQ